MATKRHQDLLTIFERDRTASDYRAMWDTIEDLWSQTVALA